MLDVSHMQKDTYPGPVKGRTSAVMWLRTCGQMHKTGLTNAMARKKLLKHIPAFLIHVCDEYGMEGVFKL